MTHLDVLSLEEAKEYLHVDYPDQDNLIEGLIKSAISFVEKYTNVHLVTKTKEYYPSPGLNYVKVFDFPFYYSGNVMVHNHAGYSKFFGNVTLELGFRDKGDVDPMMITIIKRIVEFYFYEDEKEVSRVQFFEGIKTELDTFRRFIV